VNNVVLIIEDRSGDAAVDLLPRLPRKAGAAPANEKDASANDVGSDRAVNPPEVVAEVKVETPAGVAAMIQNDDEDQHHVALAVLCADPEVTMAVDVDHVELEGIRKGGIIPDHLHHHHREELHLMRRVHHRHRLRLRRRTMKEVIERSNTGAVEGRTPPNTATHVEDQTERGADAVIAILLREVPVLFPFKQLLEPGLPEWSVTMKV